MNPPPTLSIVVPTHNRSAMLMKNLAALSHQSGPDIQFEVLVVADACHDDTAEMVTAYATQTPYRLCLLSHCARSAAATRNLGATNAQGRVLLFLDDDVVLQPGSVRAHVEAQRGNRVVLGYSKPVLPAKPSWWQYDARRWWQDTYRAMGQPGHRFTYRDFFSGNVSMPATLFHEAGGFDTSFTGRLEDYELGMRLLKVGARFRFVPEAIGYHYENSDLDLWLRRVRQEGAADVQIGQRHPELRTSLFGRLKGPRSRRKRILLKFAFAQPQRGDWLERLLLHQTALYERLRLRGRWRRVVGLLRDYNYCRGVAATIGGQRAWAAWLQEAPVPPTVASSAPVVDMAAPPPPDVLQGVLEQATNTGLRLALEGVEVVAIPPQPGAEPLREEHLHRALQQLVERQFVPALALHLIRSTRGGSILC
jgi:GT2 family glycosyltransferase